MSNGLIATEATAAKSSRFETICRRIIEISLFAIVILVPLTMGSFTEELFALPKATVLRVLTCLAIVAWLLKSINSRRFSIAKTWLDVPILAYLLVNVAATITSVSVQLSLFSTIFRQDGIITLANYVIIFYLAATVIRGSEGVLRFLQVEVVAGMLVALYGLTQHFGFWFIGIDPNYFGSRAFSTVGNPGFLGGYLVILLPLALVLAVSSRSLPGRILWLTATALLGMCLLYTYTRGAWVGMGVSIGALVFLSRRRILEIAPWALVAAAIVLALLLAEQRGLLDFLGAAAGTPTSTAGTEELLSNTLERMADTSPGGTGEVRLLLWRGALDIMRDYPILGTGPNTFMPVFSKYAPIEYTRGEGLDRFPDKPHNLFLEVATGSGIVGFLAFASILTIWGLRGLVWSWRADGREAILVIGLLSSWIGFLANGFFLFFVIESGALFWLNMAMMIALIERDGLRREVRFSWPNSLRPVLYVTAVGLGVFLFYLSLRPLVADYYMRQAVANLRNVHGSAVGGNLASEVQNARHYAELALQWNPYEVSYYTKMAGIVDMEAKVATDPIEQRIKLDETVDYYTKAIDVNPRMASLYYLRGAEYEAYGDDHLRDALADYEKSTEFYPYYYNGNAGIISMAQKLGLPSEAIVAERRLAEVFPHLTSNLVNLGTDLYSMGRYQESIDEWEKILKFEPDNAEVRYRIGQAYATIGDKERAIAEYRRVLEIDPSMTSAQKAVDILEGRAEPDGSHSPNAYH